MKLFILLGCPVLLAGFLIWRMFYGEMFSASALARLRPGMTTNEVIAILGAPSSRFDYRWHYTSPLMFNVGIVTFDASGNFSAAIND